MFCQLYVDSVEKYLSAAHATAECGAMMEGHRHQVFQAQAPLVLYIFFFRLRSCKDVDDHIRVANRCAAELRHPRYNNSVWCEQQSRQYKRAAQ